MGQVLPKQYLTLHGQTILAHTLHGLLSCPKIEKIVVVLATKDPYWPQLQPTFPAGRVLTTIGGSERFLSVYQGLLALESLAKAEDWVLVHDAVRPCLPYVKIDEFITCIEQHSIGGLIGIPIVDTLKHCDEGRVISTIDRTNIWQAQTPQMFKLSILKKALGHVIAQGLQITDEASAVELLGEPMLMLEGHPYNIKITQPADLLLVESLMPRIQRCELVTDSIFTV